MADKDGKTTTTTAPTKEEIEAARAEYLEQFHQAAEKQIEELESTRENLHGEVDNIVNAAKEALVSDETSKNKE